MKTRRNSLLLENLDSKVSSNLSVRRYNLPDMISESYRALYDCKKGSNLQKIVEAHLNDVRNSPTDIDRLSRQLCTIKELIRMTEAEEINDKDLKSVVQSKIEGEVKESKDDETVEKKDDNDVIDESVHDEDVEETDDEDLLEDTDLTDEEVDELTKHLEEIRKNKKVQECSDEPKIHPVPRRVKAVNESINGYVWSTEWSMGPGEAYNTKSYHKNGSPIVGIVYEPDGEDFEDYGVSIYNEESGEVLGGSGYEESAFGFESEEEAKKWVEHWFSKNVNECDSPKNEVQESTKPRKLMRRANESKKVVKESKSYEKLDLSEFNKKSSSKAFVKTFKKLDSKLHEGTALTRQESISLYKAANSAMTHLSVELEHNPEFLDTFKESVSLLSEDVNKLLGSLKEGKAPSKATMKSLAKFSEALLHEDDEEDLPPVEDEEEDVVSNDSEESNEAEEFDQEDADARVDLHKELADEHADTDDPEIQEKLAQDADEVTSLPGITDEQVAEIQGEETSEVEDTDESVHDEDVEEVEEKKEEKKEEPADLDLGGDEITDDELAELKKHLKEMRQAKVNESRKSKK